MLQRAKRLQSTFDKYCIEHAHPQFKLSKEEWRQIEYLLCLTQPFFEFTTALCKTKEVTVHIVFDIYNSLFDHLERSIHQLQRKKVPWKKAILRALEAGKDKLSFYYSKTTQVHGNLYAIGTILAPEYKLQFFSGREWADNNYDWRDKYLGYLQDYMEPYKQRLSSGLSHPRTQIQADQGSQLKSLLSRTKSHPSTVPIDHQDELKRYLESGIYYIPLYKLLKLFTNLSII